MDKKFSEVTVAPLERPKGSVRRSGEKKTCFGLHLKCHRRGTETLRFTGWNQLERVQFYFDSLKVLTRMGSWRWTAGRGFWRTEPLLLFTCRCFLGKFLKRRTSCWRLTFGRKQEPDWRVRTATELLDPPAWCFGYSRVKRPMTSA